MAKLERFLPLNPATLHILVVLAADERHGYSIMQEVERQSLGQYKLSAGTLYDNLQKLLDQGLVLETTRNDEGSRRRYYKLSSLGRKVLGADLDRLASAIREARMHIRTAKPRRA
jgi:DNA-binding PadR family transcriptional regulator